ncbi:MarR family winged helix-turn-helix transcriptional regulator [Streptomyces sp. AN091965]|uniref:MarR family winged helix-turn-helix transcriptional regulator n=1 Tax=Streptomyces sp. AN091965 TaxID=2927803 RepID=UPI001F609958|nr:MarR family transcriptional regulator [Streptomyces sp. AN091965]MCI3928203.1 MarR family transcriptional regulator [Streptomyces sp. AN091965]
MVTDYGQRLPYIMRMVSNALSQQLERTLRQFSLNHAQFAALAQLGLEQPGGLSGAELGHRAGVTAQSMSAAVASLLDRGLVSRTPHPTHGRILEVRITPEGLDLVERAQAAAKHVEDRAVAGLTPAQQGELRALLGQITRTLGLYAPEPRSPQP